MSKTLPHLSRSLLPPLQQPSTIPYEHAFPHTATVSLLPLRPEENYRPGFIIMGGAIFGASPTTPATSLSYRLDLTYCNASGTSYCLPAGDAK